MHTFGTVISFKILPVNVYTQGDEGMIKIIPTPKAPTVPMTGSIDRHSATLYTLQWQLSRGDLPGVFFILILKSTTPHL